jgi:hypothetical protein
VAVFSSALLLFESALKPTAVLKLPVLRVFAKSALAPTAVLGSFSICHESTRPDGRIGGSGSIISECISSVRRVKFAFRIANERERSIGRVVGTSGIA